MLTNNFINLSKIVMLCNNYNKTTYIKVRDISGVERYLVPVQSYAYPSSDSMDSFTTNYSAQGWSVGSGTTPPSVNDYQLESTIGSNISGKVSTTPISDESLNRIIKRITVIVTNNGSTNMIIGEIGYKSQLIAGSAIGATGNSSQYLLYREVLESPVTLAPGDSTSFVIDFYVTTE